MGENAIFGVEQEPLCVGEIGLDGFGLRDQILVEEELTDVGDIATGEGVIPRIDGRVDVGKDWRLVTKHVCREWGVYVPCMCVVRPV